MRVYPNRTPLGKGLDELLHAGGGVALHLVGNVTVDVHREGGCGVAERFGNGLDVRAVLDGEGRESVAQVVQAYGGVKTDGRNDAFEGALNSIAAKGCADLVGEDEVVGVVPRLSGGKAAGNLFVLDAAKGVEDAGGRAESALLIVLQGREAVDVGVGVD